MQNAEAEYSVWWEFEPYELEVGKQSMQVQIDAAALEKEIMQAKVSVAPCYKVKISQNGDIESRESWVCISDSWSKANV